MESRVDMRINSYLREGLKVVILVWDLVLVMVLVLLIFDLFSGVSAMLFYLFKILALYFVVLVNINAIIFYAC
jgi:hypothetical protein